MGRLTLAFLWHMHQPFYVNVADGRATLPWARLHALKDYRDVPAIARRFPAVKQTFNLVPSLLDQIQGYVEGRLTDPFLEVAKRRAHELTREDRLFLLREFFSYNPSTMAAKLPRLEQLRRLRGARAPGPEDDAALAAFRESDFRDLQVLFHLAWCGPALSALPAVSRLIEKGTGFTQEELGVLLDLQQGFLDGIRTEYREGVREGTLEISVSPYYHPILPLLCDTESAREASPRLPLPALPFRHPEDARIQVREARRVFARLFGGPPEGMWPSEGAVSNGALRILAEEGVRWAASDEDLLFASLGHAPRDLAERSRILHRPYVSTEGTFLFFRDHALSDQIGFVYSSWSAEAAATDFMNRLAAIAHAAGGEERVVSVILDGENAWEFYPGNGEPFLAALFERIAASDAVEARTFSAILEDCERRYHPGSLPPLRAGSWIRSDLTTWIGDPAKNRAWERLAEAREALGPPDPETAWGASLLAAEGSDWFWWFGDEHSSAHDADFDRTFRMHLQNGYALLGRDVPVSLGQAIAGPAEPHRLAEPVGRVLLVLDGRASDYFEWLSAARVDADLGRGAMSRAGRLLRRLLYGLDGDLLAVRLDTIAEPARDVLDGLVVAVEFVSPAETRVRATLRPGSWQDGALRGCLDRVLEMSLPLSRVVAASADRIAFRVVLEDAEGRRLESLPGEGFASFSRGPEGADWLV